MSIRTLREVCEVLKISRRTIQGYEELGLLVPSGKNERGWLLYDEACQERIKLLRFYQNAGFQGKEIIVLLAAEETERKRMLRTMRERLRDEVQEKERLIEEISRMVEEKLK